MKIGAACLCAFFLFGTVFSVAGDVTAQRLVRDLGLRRKVPSSEENQEYRLRKIVPVSQTRALALISHEWMEWIGPTPTPSAFRKPLWEGNKTFTFHESVMLAFLNREGKVVSWTPLDSEGNAAGTGARWEDAHLLSIEADPCPYAVIPPDREKLFCFDWQLNAMASYKIPPAVYTGVAPVFTTEGLEVWLFPKAGSGPKGERATPSYEASVFEPVENLELVGFRLKIPSGEVQPLAVDASELVRRLQLLANKGREEPLQLQPGSVRILPTKLTPTVPPVRVVITVVASSSFENEVHFTGERLFFLAELGEREVGKLQQLPFRFRQEEGAEANFDEKNGVVVLPAFVEPWYFKAFEAGKNGVAVFCDVGLMDAEQAKAVQEGRPVEITGWTFLLVADKNQAKLIDRSEIKTAVSKLATNDLLVVASPQLLGSFGPSELVFTALYQEGNQQPQRGFVIVDLGF